MRRIIFLAVLVLLPQLAAADTPNDKPTVKATESEKPKIGQDVIDFKDAAASSAKTGLYFVAILLLAFGAWKKFTEKKNGPQKNIISIVSRSSLGPRAGLIVAEVEGERFLLSQTPEHINLISKLNSTAFNQVLNDEFDSIEVSNDKE